MPLPHVTADLPGTGGALRTVDDDFRVDEVPAYAPAGQGDHVFVWIEKRGLTTPAAVDALARAVSVKSRDVGWAGMKDRHAVTRQWLSLPPPVTPERAAAVSIPGLTVLEAHRHPHKLRTGHLRGNRFVLRVRGVGDADAAARRARAILTALAEAPGAPNWYGEQRFGRAGDNADAGKRLVLGLDGGGGGGGRRPARGADRHRRLLVSAFQSELFNEWLRRRLADGLYRRVIAGDILQKRRSGGIFGTDDPTVDQARVVSGEIAVTGPMFGHAMRAPAPGSLAAEREAEILAWAGVALDDFRRVGALAEGTRRPLAVELDDVAVAVAADVVGAVDVSFTLPSGAYATTVMREVMKTDAPAADDAPAAEGDDQPEASEGPSSWTS